jgi:hypothetical protein
MSSDKQVSTHFDDVGTLDEAKDLAVHVEKIQDTVANDSPLQREIAAVEALSEGEWNLANKKLVRKVRPRTCKAVIRR